MADSSPIEQQTTLLPEPVSPAPESFFSKLEETTGEYTAERLRIQRPDDYNTVLVLLARGWRGQRIEDWFHEHDKRMSKNTVKAVLRSQGETIDLLRERLAADCFEAAEQDLEASRLMLDEIMADKKRRAQATVRDVQALRVSAGIAIQNGQLLAGLPTARVQLEDLRRPDHDDFNRMLKALPVVETTHCIAEMTGQKERLEAAVGDCGLNAGSTESESVVKQQ